MFGYVDLCAACDDLCSLFRCLCSTEESGKLFVDYIKKIGVGAGNLCCVFDEVHCDIDNFLLERLIGVLEVFDVVVAVALILIPLEIVVGSVVVVEVILCA